MNGSRNQLTEYFENHLDEMLSDLKRVVECESPSGNVKLLNSCADTICGIIEDRTGIKPGLVGLSNGSRAISFSTGPNEGKGILVLCHHDTVFPEGTLKRRPFRISGDRIEGPGVFDMKTGLIQGIWALRFVLDNAIVRKRISFLITPDEETGSMLSRQLIEEEGKLATLGLVLEPSENGKLKTGRKGVGTYEIMALGRSAHAGLHPEDGINAIQEIAHVIGKLPEFQDLSKGTTINVGTINGGTATNVVPEMATIGVDVRVASLEEAGRVDECIRAIMPDNPAAKITVAGGMNRLPMRKNEKTEKALMEIAEIGSSFGIRIEDTSVGGGSDGNIIAQYGMAVIDGIGAVGSGAHSDSEYVQASSIPLRTALLAGTLIRFTGAL
ncbi:MAG: M20 family metallopeptidase [Thermoplasmataceae archaeon]